MILIKDTEPTADKAKVRISASRGRGGQRPFHQVIELGSSQATNTITSVQKDNLVWIEVFP
jgi:hypothetical protein